MSADIRRAALDPLDNADVDRWMGKLPKSGKRRSKSSVRGVLVRICIVNRQIWDNGIQ